MHVYIYCVQAKEDLSRVTEQRHQTASAMLAHAVKQGHERGIEGQLQKLRDIHALRRTPNESSTSSNSNSSNSTAAVKEAEN